MSGYEVGWTYVAHDRHHPDPEQRCREEHDVTGPDGVWLGTFPTAAAAQRWIELVRAEGLPA